MRVEIIKFYVKEELEDFEFKINQRSQELENNNNKIINIKVVKYENYLISIITYKPLSK